MARLVIANNWAWLVADYFHFVAFSRLMGGALGRFLIRRRNVFANRLMPTAVGDRRCLTGSGDRPLTAGAADPGGASGERRVAARHRLCVGLAAGDLGRPRDVRRQAGDAVVAHLDIACLCKEL